MNLISVWMGIKKLINQIKSSSWKPQKRKKPQKIFVIFLSYSNSLDNEVKDL